MRAPACRPLPVHLAVFLAAALTGSSAFAEETGVSTTPPVSAAKSPPMDESSNPARLDVITFNMFTDGENHKMVVTLGPVLVRLDAIEDRYSVIYDPRSDDYIGLEHSNYTYWQFSWPAVKAKVAQSKRYEAHLRDLLSQGISSDDLSSDSVPPPTNSTDADTSLPSTAGTDSGNASSSAGSGPDNNNYIWKQTDEHKKIAGLDCIRWTGESVSNPDVEAWCYAGSIPVVRDAMEKIRAMNEPMALVPVRTLVPAFLFTVYDSIVKGGGTPILVSWGGDVEKNKFSFAKATTINNRPALFAIPKLYIKTTLVTMDGITQPIGGGN